MNTASDMVIQGDSTNDDDAEFWQSLGTIKESILIEGIADKQVSTSEESRSAPEAKQSKWNSVSPYKVCGSDTSKPVLSHMRILAHTRMGHPICVYSYGTPIRVWDSILSHMSILFACFISLQVFGYCWYKQI